MNNTTISSIKANLATFCPSFEFRVYNDQDNFINVEQLSGTNISYELKNSIKNKYSATVVYFK